MLNNSISEKDKAVLKVLQNNADITNADLAKQVELSPSACLTRVKNLKTHKIIRGIHAKLNADALGFNFHVFIYIRLSNQVKETLSYLEGAVKMNTKIQDCFRMTGEYDYVLRVLLKNTSELEYFLTHELSRIPDIASIRTEVAMKCVKQDPSLAL
ncbi:MAG: ArsR family transcriptional regulator [Gammaproteobacteria bacterium]|nr:ArsR family transcriptional regulator [Gammaproteobacteria bacterium]|tara:strand:- start:329 stop:796 length:468 start_codon:yes stop_codon:yes gene_type:complete